MKLTDEQKRILIEAADIFSAVGDEEIFYSYEDFVTGDRLACKIVGFVVSSDYDYDSPIGPEEKSLHDLKENIVEFWFRHSIPCLRSLEKH